MTATAGMIASVRAKLGNISAATVSDGRIQDAIELYPLVDADDNKPADTDWTATYDLNRAAADLWGERAAEHTCAVDNTIDGQRYADSQKFAHAMRMANYYRSLAAAAPVELASYPPPVPENAWVINRAEDDTL